MYPILVTISLLLVAGSSIYMSVYGLMAAFVTDASVVMCMGLGMEIGKILTVAHCTGTGKNSGALPKACMGNSSMIRLLGYKEKVALVQLNRCQKHMELNCLYQLDAKNCFESKAAFYDS